MQALTVHAGENNLALNLERLRAMARPAVASESVANTVMMDAADPNVPPLPVLSSPDPTDTVSKRLRRQKSTAITSSVAAAGSVRLHEQLSRGRCAAAVPVRHVSARVAADSPRNWTLTVMDHAYPRPIEEPVPMPHDVSGPALPALDHKAKCSIDLSG